MAQIIINEISQNYTYNIGTNSYCSVALPITAAWGPAFMDIYNGNILSDEDWGTEDNPGLNDLYATRIEWMQEQVAWQRFPATQAGLEAFLSTYRGPAAGHRLAKDFSYQMAMTLLVSGYDVWCVRLCPGEKAIGRWLPYYPAGLGKYDKEGNIIGAMVNPDNQPYTNASGSPLAKKEYGRRSPGDANQFANFLEVFAKYPGTFGNNIRLEIKPTTRSRRTVWTYTVFAVDTTGVQTAVEHQPFLFDVTDDHLATFGDTIPHINEVVSRFVDFKLHGRLPNDFETMEILNAGKANEKPNIVKVPIDLRFDNEHEMPSLPKGSIQFTEKAMVCGVCNHPVCTCTPKNTDTTTYVASDILRWNRRSSMAFGQLYKGTDRRDIESVVERQLWCPTCGKWAEQCTVSGHADSYEARDYVDTVTDKHLAKDKANAFLTLALEHAITRYQYITGLYLDELVEQDWGRLVRGPSGETPQGFIITLNDGSDILEVNESIGKMAAALDYIYTLSKKLNDPALDEPNITEQDEAEIIEYKEWLYTNAIYVYDLLKDKLQYNPKRIVSPGWDDQDFNELDGEGPRYIRTISPLHKVLMDAAYYSRCATSFIDIPRSAARNAVYRDDPERPQQPGYAQMLARLQAGSGEYDQNSSLFHTHSALFTPWGQYQFTGTNKQNIASPSFQALAIQRSMILNQAIQYEWLLPSQRKHALRLGTLDYKVPKKLLDVWQKLEGVGVNIITQIPDMGIGLWGNSTLFEVPPVTYNALANLSTRFLMNAVKDIAYKCGLTITFQYNNEQAYNKFYAGVTPVLDTMRNVGAIEDYYVRMQADLNGLDQVNANTVIGKIYLVVNGVINDIIIDLIALPPGTDLDQYRA